MAVAPRQDRVSLGHIQDYLELPDLIEIQTKSYGDFLQWDTPPDERHLKGLQEVFLEVFPIASPNGLTKLEFVNLQRFAEGPAAFGPLRGSGHGQ